MSLVTVVECHHFRVIDTNAQFVITLTSALLVRKELKTPTLIHSLKLEPQTELLTQFHVSWEKAAQFSKTTSHSTQDYKLADAILNQSIIAEAHELSSQCLTSNLEIVTNEHSKEIIKTLKLKNNGSKNWPKPVYLTCLTESSTITGNSVPIKLKVESGKENNVEIKLNNKDLKTGNYISVWQLQTEKKEFFGEKIVLNIKIEKSKMLEIKPSYIQLPKDVFQQQPVNNNIIINSVNNNINSNVEKPREEIYDSFVFQCQVEELKQAYDLKKYDDKTIKKAAVEAKGDVDMTFQILMNNQQKK